MKTHGRCWKFGDNIPTDQIVRVDRALGSMEEMAQHVLENYNPRFAREVKPGDVLVAGKHFGQSSGRAVAPKAIKATGVGVVVVEYASRLFFRNAFEVGLPLLECPGITGGVEDGDILLVDPETGKIVNETRRREFQAKPVAPFLMEMLKAGGLIEMAPKLADEA
ncbi:MAG: 3-isopropylmalate dehydratase small subunit [Spirochaetaceae bacterium]|jgi:3-isopropylmalate/(R)-2-methylmalate dehydratase small subunit|nr:3-isopropylmalate dehydratase small subunit [Spirochaetaceae bacterium]